MDRFGSEDWMAAVRAAADVLPAAPGCSANVGLEISGGPDGVCRMALGITDGRLTALVRGRPADADCTVSCSHDDARSMLAGRLDPAVAYMQGRLKLDGAYELLLFGLRPVITTPEFSTFAANLRSLLG